MTHPHLEGLIPEVPPLPKNPDSADCARRVGYAEAVDEMRRRVAALAALPGGGVDWLDGVPTESGWYWHWDGEVFRMHFVFSRPGHAYLCTEGEPYGPGQKRNFQAVQRMGGRWSAQVKTPALPTPNPHEADRNG